MASKRFIQVTFWTSGKLKGIGPAGKVFLSWAQTNPRSNMLGFFKVSFDDCVDETELSVKQIQAAIKASVARNFIRYDPGSRFLWIVNRLDKEFPTGQMNDIQRKACQKDLENASCHGLVWEICQKYTYFGEPFVSLGERVRLRVSPSHKAWVRKQEAESRKQEEESRKPEAGSLIEEFEKEFWPEWPAEYRTNKRDALREYITARRKPTSKEDIIGGVIRQKEGRRWREGYVPHPDRWLRKGRWTDAVIGAQKVSREAQATGQAAAEFIKRKEGKHGGKDV